MENRKTVIIERVKNIIIVVLFLNAILLLSFFWKDFSINDFGNFGNLHFGMSVEDDTYQPELHELIVPAHIETGFGNGMHTVVNFNHVIPDDIAIPMPVKPEGNDEENNQSATADEASVRESTVYNSVLAAVEHYLTGTDLLVEKIEKSQYDEVMSYRSITAVFDYDIPFKEFLQLNNLTDAGGIDNIGHVSRIGFSSASAENMFIYDNSLDAYYRIANYNKETANLMSEAILDISEALEQEGNATYYSIESLVGTENNALMPLYLDSDLTEISIREAFNINRESSVSRMEQLFFPGGLDFVRKITENKGALLYMYGYSEKVLMLEANGTISYEEEFETKGYKESTFTEALNTAVGYIATHGGWRSLYSESVVPYIADCDVRVEGVEGYRSYDFTIGMMFEGTPVDYASGDLIRVCVYGDQVTSYFRDIIIPEAAQAAETWTAIDAINVVTDEHVAICEILEEKEKAEGNLEKAHAYAGENKFDEMMREADSIRLSYLRDSKGHPATLVPVWALEIDGCHFWCDPLTGDLLMYDAGEVN